MSRTKRENHIGDHTMKNDNATGIKHSLSVDLCIDLGNDVVAALIFHHIQINVRSRLADNVLDENGTPWFECSYSGICNYMIELTPKKVECGIKRLKEAKLIKVITSNKKNKYTLTECGWDYYPLTEEEKKKINIPVAEAAEADKAAVQTRSDGAINKKVINVSDDVKDVIDYVSQKVGKHYDYANSYVKNINSLFAAGYTKADMIAVVDDKFDDLSGTKEFNVKMNPSKLFFIKTFPSLLRDAKGNSDVSMTPDQLIADSEKKEEYHLKEAERCRCERLILEADPDNLPFLTIKTTPEEMIKDRVRKERYHRNEANKFANMRKYMKSVK
uniref:conserved phage C-terminal domain-containing protein n=1 Tax=Holdemanella biformis TaxID=1735 RepID=UPI0026602CEC|nr:conserved phage C-terminal domain-containing protein [Holdemanella biformis]